MVVCDVCCHGNQEMLGEVTSRRQAVVTLTFQVEQLLKQSSTELTAEQAGELESLTDDVRHRLNTVSTSCYMSASLLGLLLHRTYRSFPSNSRKKVKKR